MGLAAAAAASLSKVATNTADDHSSANAATGSMSSLTLADLLSARGDSFAVRDGQIVQVQGEPGLRPAAGGPSAAARDAPTPVSGEDPGGAAVMSVARPAKFPPLMQFQDDSFYVSGEIFAGLESDLHDVPYLRKLLKLGSYPVIYPVRDAERALCTVFREVGGPRAGRVRIHTDMQQAPLPEMWRLWNALGVTWRCEGFARRAIVCLLQALRLQRQANDNSVGVRFNIAMVLQHAGLLAEAQEVLEAVLQDTLPLPGEKTPANQRVYLVALCELEARLKMEEPGRACIDRFALGNTPHPGGPWNPDKKDGQRREKHPMDPESLASPLVSRLGLGAILSSANKMLGSSAGVGQKHIEDALREVAAASAARQMNEMLASLLEERRAVLQGWEAAALTQELQELGATGVADCGEVKACLQHILDKQGVPLMSRRASEVLQFRQASRRELAEAIAGNQHTMLGGDYGPADGDGAANASGELVGESIASLEQTPLFGRLYADDFYLPPPGSGQEPLPGEPTQMFARNGQVGGRNKLEAIRNSHLHPKYENLDAEKGVCQVFGHDGGVDSARHVLVESLMKLGTDNPQSWELWNGLGNSWRCEGHAFRALQCFLKAEGLLGRPDASIAVNMASVLRHLGFTEDARRIIEGSLSKTPEQLALASHMWCDITVALVVAGVEDVHKAERCLRDLPGRMPGLESEVRALRKTLSRVRPWWRRTDAVLLLGCFGLGALAFGVVLVHLQSKRSKKARLGSGEEGQKAHRKGRRQKQA